MASIIIVFSNQVHTPWLKILTRGYRHCFAIIEVDTGWVVIDALSHQTIVHPLSPIPANELAAWYQGYNHKTIITKVQTPPLKAAPFGFFSCVKSVKRLAGIHHRFILTPHQLWRFLNKG